MIFILSESPQKNISDIQLIMFIMPGILPLDFRYLNKIHFHWYPSINFIFQLSTSISLKILKADSH